MRKKGCLLFPSIPFHSRDIKVFKIWKLAKWWCNIVNQVLIKHDEKRNLSQFLCAPQYKLKRFDTLTTYWVPDLSNIKGFSGHLWHSILIFANKAPYGGRRGGLMVSALDSGVSGPGSSPGRGHCVVFLGRHFTSTVPLSTQVYKRVWANCWGNLTNCGEGTCYGLASHPGEVEVLLAASYYRHRDKLRKLWASLGSKTSLFYG